MVDMGSIIESIREARDVKAKFVGDGKIGKLKYNITYDGSSDSYDIYCQKYLLSLSNQIEF